MRATRAYLAGFGTAGSLLAGAALMFVLASALIAFRGWPQVATPSSQVSVGVPRADRAAAARASHVVIGTAASRAAHAQAAAHFRVGGGSHHGRTHSHARAISGSTTRTHSSTGGPAGSGTTGDPSQKCSTSCGSRHRGPVANTVSRTVAAAQQTVKSTVSTVGGTVKKILPKGSSGSGGSASTVGQTVAGGSGAVKQTLP